MSTSLVEQLKQLAIELSPAEKSTFAEWLIGDISYKPKQRGHSIRDSWKRLPINDDINDVDRVEPALSEFSSVSPKTGAEIAAMLESGEIDMSAWHDLEISDSVAWLKNLRNQEQKQRGLEL